MDCNPIYFTYLTTDVSIQKFAIQGTLFYHHSNILYWLEKSIQVCPTRLETYEPLNYYEI